MLKTFPLHSTHTGCGFYAPPCPQVQNLEGTCWENLDSKFCPNLTADMGSGLKNLGHKFWNCKVPLHVETGGQEGKGFTTPSQRRVFHRYNTITGRVSEYHH